MRVAAVQPSASVPSRPSRELAGDLVVHRHGHQCLDLGQVARELGTHGGLGSHKHADPRLGDRDDGNPTLGGKLGEGPFLLAGDEHRRVEDPSQSSSIVAAATPSTSSRKADRPLPTAWGAQEGPAQAPFARPTRSTI